MGTYVEDYLESMYMLPSEIKRNFDLMRDLDKVRLLSLASLALILTAFFTDILPALRRPKERAESVLNRLETKGARAVQRRDEK